MKNAPISHCVGIAHSMTAKTTIPFFDDHNTDFSMILEALGFNSSKFVLKLKNQFSHC